MSPDPLITSILNRYEHDEPVTIEEKAVLHQWLMNALRRKDLDINSHQRKGSVRSIRKKVHFWEYAFIVLIVVIVIFMLYLLSTKPDIVVNQNDNFHVDDKEFRKPW